MLFPTRSCSTGLLCLLLGGLALSWPATPAPVSAALRVAGTGQRPVLHPLRAPDPAAAVSSVDGDLARRRYESEKRVRERLGPHGVSRKALLHRETRLAKLRTGEITAAEPEVLRILLVRIAFETDRTGPLTSVTEDGNFVFDDPDSLYPFDPAPHDKAYFEAHLRGLAEYWTTMSDGRLDIDARVLPEGDRDAYMLGDIADYGPCKELDPEVEYGSVSEILEAQAGCPDAFWTIDGLVDLVQDMITVTDDSTQADQSVNLADYDFDDPNTYIIFAHAGGDLQSNLVWDPSQPGYSPNDIPTFFVMLGDDDAVDLTSADSETGERGRITECSVIPESTTQDGLLGSIAAALYHEFGHALGLPDLYDTFTGLPTVGFWDIMDSGTNLTAGVQLGIEDEETCERIGCFWDEELEICACEVVGLLPPSTSIWCKWYLGWVDPVRIGAEPRDVEVFASHAQGLLEGEAKAALLDVASDEFFLLENRFVSPSPAGLVLFSDPGTGVVLYLARDTGTITLPNSHQYDYYLPWGGGLLFWRIRQDRIDERIGFNVVQNDPAARGVELIEADGIQDVGVFEFTTLGFLGSMTDAFRDQSWFDVGGDSLFYPRTATEITPDTTPSTASSFRLPTGARIENISATPSSDRVPMTLRSGVGDLIRDGEGVSALPAWLPTVVGVDGADVPLRGDAQSLTLAAFDGGPGLVVIGAPADGSGSPELFAYDLVGAPRFPGRLRISGLSAPLVGPPLWAESFRSGEPALITVGVDGQVRAFSSRGVLPGDDQADELWGLDLPDSADGSPSVVRLPGAGPADPDRGFLVVPNVARNLVMVVDEDGQLRDWSGNFPLNESNPLRSTLLAADLEGTGRVDKLTFVAGSRLQGTEVSGQTLDGFPVPLPSTFSSEPGERFWLLAWPRPGEEPGPDRVVIVAEDLRERPLGVVMRADRDSNGRWLVEYLGRVLSSPPVADPALGDLDGDGRLELFVATRERLWVRNEAGIDLTGFPIRLAEQHLHGQEADGPASAPLVADVDGDGLNEVVVISRVGLVYAFEHDGRLTPGYPRRPAGAGTIAPLVADAEVGSRSVRGLYLFEALGDSLSPGRQTRSARLTGLDLGVPPADPPENRPAEWLARGGDGGRSYRAKPGAPSRTTTGVAALQATPATIYPNPVRFDLSVRAHFYSGGDQMARVTIYNLEGEQVLTQEQFNQADVEGEVAFDPRTLVPGAYVCKLEYVGLNGPATAILPLYVER